MSFFLTISIVFTKEESKFYIYSLQAQIVTLKGGVDSKQYRHNQQLEELRNLQDKLSMEKTAWAATKDQETRELEEKKTELIRLQVWVLTLLCLVKLSYQVLPQDNIRYNMQ